MKHLIAATAAAALALAATGPAFAAETAPASAQAPKFSTNTTTIGDLIDNPATKAVLVKHVAPLIENPQIEMARPMTLKQVQGFAGDALSDEVLARIDADLAAIK
jgi:Flp pilus assembly protein TadD